MEMVSSGRTSMYKRWLSIILVFTILATLVRFTLPYLWYYSNQSYIVTELCIHQHRTDHVCDGTCQLKKMVQKQHDHTNDQSRPPVEKEQKINLFIADYISFAISLQSPSLLKVKLTERESLWIGEPILPP